MRILGPVAKKIRDEGHVDLELVRDQRLQRYALRPKPEPKKTPAQILAASGKKKCCRCQQEKPFEEFSARSSSADGKNYQCKICERDRVKEYYKPRKKAKAISYTNPEWPVSQKQAENARLACTEVQGSE
jgi:hypothetical protein